MVLVKHDLNTTLINEWILNHASLCSIPPFD